jgi:UDP-glucose 4-epimerase
VPRALVTGGAGFIGSTLADALLASGWDVTVVDDLSRGLRAHVPRAAAFHEVDVASEALLHAMRAERPDVVFHQAAQIDVRRSVGEPVFDARVNVVGTVNVLQACVDAGVRRVVFASSGGALYGDTGIVPTPEEHPALPASNYGAAKQCGEVYGGVYARLHGLEVTSLRYGNVYGPRQDPHGEAGVVAIFAQRLLDDGVPVINGDGRQTRDYVYVADVVRANLLAAAGPVGAYNIGTGRETDVVTIHRLLAAACGRDDPPQFGPGKPGEQRRSCLDVSLAAARLGWRAEVELEQGLQRTMEYFRDR